MERNSQQRSDFPLRIPKGGVRRSKWSGKKNFGQNLYNDYKNLKDELTEDVINESWK